MTVEDFSNVWPGPAPASFGNQRRAVDFHGEHDIYDNGALYRERFGKNTTGAGWYSFDQKGVHFIGLVNVANIQEGGLGTLGQEQLDWLEKDVKSLSASTPVVLFAHIPLWAVYPKWGWGTDDAERALAFV